MDEQTIAAAARHILAERTAGARLAPFAPGTGPIDEPAGYAVQRAVHRLGDEPLAGYKIGCTTPVMQRFLGIDAPAAGGMVERGRLASACTLHHRDFRRVGFEGEIAVTLGADLAAGPFDRTRVADAVGSCHVAIEVVDDRYTDFAAVGVPTLIADDFFHAGFVLGPAVADWRSLDLAAAEGAMRIDGEVIERGRGEAVMGHPLAALAWLADLLAAQSRPLRAGATVLLGSLVTTRWLTGEHEVAFAVEGLGAVSLHLRD